MKAWRKHPDPLLAYLSYGLINRRLFRLEFSDEPFEEDYVERVRAALRDHRDLPRGAEAFLIIGQETNNNYSVTKDEIMILKKSGDVVPMSTVSDFGIAPRTFRKWFLCYPKEITRSLQGGR